MSDDSAFLIYSLIFRLGVMAAGLFSIFLGFLLFRGPNRPRGVRSGPMSTVDASLLGVRFRLQNVAAGGIFALFGAILIVAMITQGNPEKTRQTLVGVGIASETVKLRGVGIDPIESLIKDGNSALERQADREAERLYRAALVRTAPAMNALAWICTKRDSVNEALPFAQAAVQLDSTNAHYFDTLANALAENGDTQAALKAAEKAAQYDPSFKVKLDRFRKFGGRKP